MEKKLSVQNQKTEKLLDLFEQNDYVTIAMIEKALSCKRHTAYNQLKKLNEIGYHCTSKIINKTAYYYIEDNYAKDYIPMDIDTIRKYHIAKGLQNGPVNSSNFYRNFAFSDNKYNKKAVNPISLDINQTTFYSLISDMIEDGDIEKIRLGNSNHPKNSKVEYIYSLTGKNIPIRMPLKNDSNNSEVNNLITKLSTIPSEQPFSKQLQTIYKKLCVLYDVPEEDDSKNYIIYGRNRNGLSKASKLFQSIKSYDYKHKVLDITFTSQKGNPQKLAMAIGLVVYSMEKNELYIIGKSSSTNYKFNNSNTIIKVSSIQNISETDLSHNIYHSKEYENLFKSMFSISAESPKRIKVEFDNEANILRKIENLSNRRNVSPPSPNNSKIIYEDDISGIKDFANYLRSFGKSVQVIYPEDLKQSLYNSVRDTLAIYKEDSSNE